MSPIKKDVTIGGQRLILGDCLEVMPLLGPVDMVCTSPPYGSIRDYGEGFDGVDCCAVITAIASALSLGGVCMWNVADQTINGSESGESFRQALHAMSVGLRLHDTMIYCKEGVTFPHANRYLPCFEYMFVFSKGAPKHFNAIRDRKNRREGEWINGTDRRKDGSTRARDLRRNSIPAFGIRRNWWVMNNAFVGETAGHPAPMPMAMAQGHIQTWTAAGEIVLDPFMGSGTTLVACEKMGRRGIGIELDPDYFEIACERVRKAHAQPDMFVPQPEPQPVQVAFDMEAAE